MTSLRRKIRNAVVDALKESPVFKEMNIFNGARAPDTPNDLPFVMVYSTSEQGEVVTQAPMIVGKTLNISIDIAIAKFEDIDEELDYLTAEVQKVIDSNESLTSWCNSHFLSNTELKLIFRGDHLIGAAGMTYQFHYQIDTSVAPFELSDAEELTVEVRKD